MPRQRVPYLYAALPMSGVHYHLPFGYLFLTNLAKSQNFVYCDAICLQLKCMPDDIVTSHDKFDVVQSLPDSPTSATAMLTFADIVASSTVKKWNDVREDHGGQGSRCVDEGENSSSSSDASTATATTVRTVVIRSNVSEMEDRGTPISGNSTTDLPKSVCSTALSISRPASTRARQLTAVRARSVSQPRPPSNASDSVPTKSVNVKSSSSRVSKQRVQ